MRHSIIFGGIDSADFGIYIGGEGTFNAPERDVEMISIPGRDGAFALDKGRFENIEVKYTVINQEPDLATFSANLEGFRNALCSQRGYQRLEDTFHPDEYRMAVFADKFEVKPIEYNTAAEFEIVFDCKPQRYLTDGETAVSVEDGDTLTNPTLFEAHPLLMVEGYGSASINGYEVSIPDGVMGDVELQRNYIGDEVSGVGLLASFYDKIKISSGIVNANDEITAGMTAKVRVQSIDRAHLKSFGTPTNVNITDGNGNSVPGVSGTAKAVGNNLECTITLSASYLYGAATQSTECELHFTITPIDGTDGTGYGTFECYIPVKFWQLKQGGELWLITDVGSIATDATGIPTYVLGHYTTSRLNAIVQDVRVDSTALIRGNPTYIDCEIGEAYKEADGELVPINKYVSIGSKLPALSPGDNEVTFDSDITSLEIIPRWWRV